MQKDSLFRLSLKAFIQNEKGEVLVVKETGRTWWDLPGGGMDDNETIETALRRELKEEVGYNGDFSYEIIGVENPHLLLRNIWQVRLIFRISPTSMNFTAGSDGDEIAWKDANEFEFSERGAERLVCYYAKKQRGETNYDPEMPLVEKKGDG